MNRHRRKRKNWLWSGFSGVLFFLMIGVFPSSASWQSVDEGFEFQTLRLESPPYDSALQLQVLRVDLRNFQVRVIDSRAFGSDRLAIKVLAQKAGALAAINGGFFTPDWKPLGLLPSKHEGRENHARHETYTGTRVVRGLFRGFRVTSRRSWFTLRLF